MQMWRSMPLGGTTLGGVLGLPGRALAGWGGESWGTMVWVEALAVPAVGWLGLGVLGLGLAATAVWTLRKRRPGLGLPVLLVLLAVPLVVVAGTVTLPNTFTNGTVADADQVNANFVAVKTAVDDNDSRIAVAQTTAEAAATGHTTDTTLDESAVDAFVANNGYATGAHTTDTTLDEAAVDAFVADNGFGLAADVSANTAAIAALGAAATGLEACPDGLTVADHDTGLLWEKKTGTFSGLVDCETAGCLDLHDVNNTYKWSSVVSEPNGDAFTDFLDKLNDTSRPSTWSTDSSASIGTQAGGCFADRCDWRLPNILELQTILTCTAGDPCIDPLFGPTASPHYWSASALAVVPNAAWSANFNSGVAGFLVKTIGLFVRAVRTGSCTH